MTLYLSRLTINRDAPARALSALLNPEEVNARIDAHHRLIWTLFADSKERKRDFLWRVGSKGQFYTLSARRPVANDLFHPPETKLFEPKLTPKDRLSFVLRANATRDRLEISRMDRTERRGKSRRVDIVMDMLREVSPDERGKERMQIAQLSAEQWMKNQGATKGFGVVHLTVEDYRVLNLGRNGDRSATYGVLDLIGEIEITDPTAFLSALASGFGRAKAWGCGLMLIRRA